jgi:transcription elongation factor Elf1
LNGDRNLEEPIEVQCPFCGEWFTTFVDVSAGAQSYTEDCQVCCRAIDMVVTVSPKTGAPRVTTRRAY